MGLRSRSMRWAIPILLVLAAGACATYREDLNRGQRLYEENEYERALAVWRYLEADMDSLSRNDQGRYAYLRGMTDYRLGGEFRADARHWLAIAKAIEQEHPGGLVEQWKTRLEAALNDLNKEVYLGTTATEGGSTATVVQPAGAVPGEEPGAEKATDAADQCSSDQDCAQDQVCQASQCVPRPPDSTTGQPSDTQKPPDTTPPSDASQPDVSEY